MRSVDSSFYKNARWKKCQEAYMKYANGICERCLANGDVVPAKIVHHKEHLTADNVGDASMAYGFDNLEALCQDCHNKEHFGEKQELPYFFKDGELFIKT